MKSAYELAMERLNASDPSIKKLTEKQKGQLSEITKKYQARIAEREVFLTKRLGEVRAQGDLDQEQQLLKQLASEKAVIEEEMEVEKNKIRNSG